MQHGGRGGDGRSRERPTHFMDISTALVWACPASICGRDQIRWGGRDTRPSGVGTSCSRLLSSCTPWEAWEAFGSYARSRKRKESSSYGQLWQTTYPRRGVVRVVQKRAEGSTAGRTAALRRASSRSPIYRRGGRGGGDWWDEQEGFLGQAGLRV